MINLSHIVIPNPRLEEAGTITVNAVVFGSAFTAPSTSVNDFIEEDDECPCKEDLNYFLMDSEMNEDDVPNAMIDLILYVCDVTSSPRYTNSPGCALKVWLRVPLPSPEIDEAIQVSFAETNHIQVRPASKLVVKSLTRNIYDKIRSSGIECMICLEEFNNRGLVLTLPCGHKFDEECVLKWFETSHVCPLCRFELPYEDQ